MLFNSYVFIFIFLPITLVVYAVIERKYNSTLSIYWLVFASLFFYSWWNPKYLLIIIFSIIFNYSVGCLLVKIKEAKLKKWFLYFGIFSNLALLGYFKYANFFVDNFNEVFAFSFNFEIIILPLAISFFTFQQITYLVDADKGLVKDYKFSHYCLFVTFFPQLIAGPIVHHQEMLPQFCRKTGFRVTEKNVSIGLTIFAIGLFKKVILADNLAIYATPVFEAANQGVLLSFFEVWIGALAYTFQLYFDFSGYSDMAIGLGRMFGVKLPLNFNSPYKSSNIAEFWRRWHMTLSRFLKDYLYIPLGGNRKGILRRYLNLMITMVLGGLWHGAGWTFVLWGGLHGLSLLVYNFWRFLQPFVRGDLGVLFIWKWFARSLTFFTILVGWVFFRSETVNDAFCILKGMVGANGIIFPQKYYPFLGSVGPFIESYGIMVGRTPYFNIWGCIWLGMAMGIVWRLPNTQEWLARYKPALSINVINSQRTRWSWRLSITWAIVVGFVLGISILGLNQASEFLYFQF